MRAKPIFTDGSGQEITEQLSGLPIACYVSRFTPDAYQYIDWHWHTELQLCIVLKGSVEWRIGTENVYAGEGEGIFINSQQVHRTATTGDEALLFCVDFMPALLCPDPSSALYIRAVEPVLRSQGLRCRKLEADSPATAQIREMYEVFAGRLSGFEFRLAARIFDLWPMLCSALEPLLDEAGADGGSAQIRSILQYIRQNYSHSLTLEEIAAHAGISRSECCRFFKRQTGQTLFDYLRQYRIRRSLPLLRETDLPVARVAAEVGFSDQSYFTACFRRMMGLTPGRYRAGKGRETVGIGSDAVPQKNPVNIS